MKGSMKLFLLHLLVLLAVSDARMPEREKGVHREAETELFNNNTIDAEEETVTDKEEIASKETTDVPEEVGPFEEDTDGEAMEYDDADKHRPEWGSFDDNTLGYCVLDKLYEIEELDILTKTPKELVHLFLYNEEAIKELKYFVSTARRYLPSYSYFTDREILSAVMIQGRVGEIKELSEECIRALNDAFFDSVDVFNALMRVGDNYLGPIKKPYAHLTIITNTFSVIYDILSRTDYTWSKFRDVILDGYEVFEPERYFNIDWLRAVGSWEELSLSPVSIVAKYAAVYLTNAAQLEAGFNSLGVSTGLQTIYDGAIATCNAPPPTLSPTTPAPVPTTPPPTGPPVPPMYTCVEKCLDAPLEDPNIRWGANKGAEPWFGSLVSGSNELPFCGASLVHGDVVLTAGHCIRSGRRICDGSVCKAEWPQFVRLGPSTVFDGTLIEVDASASIIHPNWKCDATSCTGGFSGTDIDIALLKLKTFSSNEAICLNTQSSRPADNSKIDIMGFGRVTDSASPTRFQGATVTTRDSCDWRGAGNSAWYFCVDVSDSWSPSTCAGDSGGPVNVASCNIQAGLVSFGNDASCLNTTAVGFQQVDTEISWIAAQICAMSSNPPSYCGTAMANLEDENVDQDLTVVAVTDFTYATLTAEQLANDWLKFRAAYPDRFFCLLQINAFDESALKIPAGFLDDAKTSYHKVESDGGDVFKQSDWFELCNLGTVQAAGINVIPHFMDVASSVAASDALFDSKALANNMMVVDVVNDGTSNWIAPFNKDF